jgi:hypothetical protein
LRLSGPSSVVHSKGALAAMRRHAVESRFYDCEQCTVWDFLKEKLDQCGWLPLRICFRVDTIRNPSKAEIPLRLDALNRAEHEVFLWYSYARSRQAESFLLLDDGLGLTRFGGRVVLSNFSRLFAVDDAPSVIGLSMRQLI